MALKHYFSCISPNLKLPKPNSLDLTYGLLINEVLWREMGTTWKRLKVMGSKKFWNRICNFIHLVFSRFFFSMQVHIRCKRTHISKRILDSDQKSREDSTNTYIHCWHYIIATSLIYYINCHCCFKFATGHKKCH